MQTQETVGTVVSPQHDLTRIVLENGRIIDATSTHAPLWAIVEGDNPRTYFDPIKMAEFESSVKEHGIIQPIIVRINAMGQLEKIAGGRRYKAAFNVFGEDYEMPIKFGEYDDQQAAAVALIENHHREGVSPTEEATYAAKLLGDFKGDRDETAKYLGWTRSTLDNRLALMALSPSSMQALNERKILLGIAELLANITKPNQDKLLPIILEKNLSVTAVKEFLQKQSKDLATAIFDREECTNCPHNSDLQASMFAEALSSGSCGNGSCYTQKTEATLLKLQTELQEKFPVVKIIRVGDNGTVKRLLAEGDAGVGAEQAEACRSCANFGGAILALPNAMGTPVKNQCFDLACNTAKVKAYQDSLKPAQPSVETKGATTQTSSNASKQTAAPSEKTKAAPPTSVAESQRVKEYREKIWRDALRKDLAQQPEKSVGLLIALSTIGNQMSKIDSGAMKTALEKISDKKSTEKTANPASFVESATIVDGLTSDDRTRMLSGMTQVIVKTLEVNYLEAMMGFMNVDLKNHWQVNEEFLKLISISEIDYLAKQIKLDVFMQAKYAPLLKLKKDDFIQGLLKSGFEFDGVIPKIMQYKK